MTVGDGNIQIKQGEGLSQAIVRELGLNPEQVEAMQKSLKVWNSIFDVACKDDALAQGESLSNSNKGENYGIRKLKLNEVIRFTQDAWNKIVKIVTEFLKSRNLVIGNLTKTSTSNVETIKVEETDQAVAPNNSTAPSEDEIFKESNQQLLELKDLNNPVETYSAHQYTCIVTANNKSVNYTSTNGESFTVAIHNENDKIVDCPTDVNEYSCTYPAVTYKYDGTKFEYRIGDGKWVPIENHKNNKAFIQINALFGNNLGKVLFANVKGMGAGDAADIINNKITEENVIEVITDFNKAAEKDGSSQSITRYLHSQWGLSRQTCAKVAEMLLKYAEGEGLNQNNSNEYANLYREYLNYSLREDEGMPVKHERANNIDAYMKALIEKMQEQSQS